MVAVAGGDLLAVSRLRLGEVKVYFIFYNQLSSPRGDVWQRLGVDVGVPELGWCGPGAGLARAAGGGGGGGARAVHGGGGLQHDGI